MADPHFETPPTDCLGQFRKADVVNFSQAPKSDQIQTGPLATLPNGGDGLPRQ